MVTEGFTGLCKVQMLLVFPGNRLEFSWDYESGVSIFEHFWSKFLCMSLYVTSSSMHPYNLAVTTSSKWCKSLALIVVGVLRTTSSKDEGGSLNTRYGTNRANIILAIRIANGSQWYDVTRPPVLHD
jgi:hypothetical protein